jgi:hypothetical protein
VIIKGNRRDGAGQLADHILRRDTNEDVIVREIASYPAKQLNDRHIRNALNLMAAHGQAKGKPRNLYHSILAPQAGESLNADQLKYAVDTLAKNLGMEGHQRVIVEHRKAGRQHFHVVFNILHPGTGRQARLQWTRKKEWNTARQLEKELKLKPVVAKGRPARRWEAERGKRSGVDPLKVRKEVTAIYKASKTGKEFIANLDKAGYVLTKGKNNSYVIVDKAGDIHGLMRRIEGAKLKDLRTKFPDLKDRALPPLARVLKQRRPARPSKEIRLAALRLIRGHVKQAYRGSRSGRSFVTAINRYGYTLGREAHRYSVIDRNGSAYSLGYLLGGKAARQINRTFPDFATLKPRPVSEIVQGIRIRRTGGSGRRSTAYDTAGLRKAIPKPFKSAPAAKERQEPKAASFRPMKKTGGWPPAAVADWKAWGHKDPAAFFRKWPELASGNPSPGGPH